MVRLSRFFASSSHTPSVWPVAERRVDRIARYVVTVATAWFAVAVSWGLLARVGGGHDAVVAARAIAADNMLTWGVWGPVREYTPFRPTPNLYYAHHPWGTFWVITLLSKLLGRHLYVPRLEPILMSVATPPLLYDIGKALWGPVPGALAALAYVVLPITLAFGNFPGFEVPLVFGCLLTTWGYVRFARRWQRRWLLVSLVGVLWVANTDWEAYVFLGVVLAFFLLAGYVLPPRVFGRVPARRFGQWWAWTASLSVATLAAYVAYFLHIGAIGGLLAQAATRAGGNQTPLSHVLKVREYWVDLMFTPVAVAVGKAALPILLARLLIFRRSLEIFPIAILAMSIVQYVHFKQGADVHIYWPLPFAPYWALSVGVLAATAVGLARSALRALQRTDPRQIVPLATLVLGGALPIAVLPDGVTGLVYGRRSAGRFNDHGHRIFQDVDKALAAEWMAQRFKGTTAVQVHSSMHSTWAIDWALHRPVVSVDRLPDRSVQASERYFICDLRFVTAAERRVLAERFHLVVVGPYALADREGPPAAADGYVFDAREPSVAEWYLASGADPVRSVRADAGYTWELRDHLGQSPNPPPGGQPRTPEELRIASDVATEAGDLQLAEQYRAELVTGLDRSAATKFTDGTLLLGVRYTPGVAPTLDVYFLAPGPAAIDSQFDVESLVLQKPPLSLVRGDDVIRAVGAPLVIPPNLWKPGFIYVERSEIRRRPGRETFLGFFTISDRGVTPPRPVDGSTRVQLLTLE